jgi:hypothetical protein
MKNLRLKTTLAGEEIVVVERLEQPCSGETGLLQDADSDGVTRRNYLPTLKAALLAAMMAVIAMPGRRGDRRPGRCRGRSRGRVRKPAAAMSVRARAIGWNPQWTADDSHSQGEEAPPTSAGRGHAHHRGRAGRGDTQIRDDTSTADSCGYGRGARRWPAFRCITPSLRGKGGGSRKIGENGLGEDQGRLPPWRGVPIARSPCWGWWDFSFATVKEWGGRAVSGQAGTSLHQFSHECFGALLAITLAAPSRIEGSRISCTGPSAVPWQGKAFECGGFAHEVAGARTLQQLPAGPRCATRRVVGYDGGGVRGNCFNTPAQAASTRRGGSRGHHQDAVPDAPRSGRRPFVANAARASSWRSVVPLDCLQGFRRISYSVRGGGLELRAILGLQVINPPHPTNDGVISEICRNPGPESRGRHGTAVVPSRRIRRERAWPDDDGGSAREDVLSVIGRRERHRDFFEKV